MNRPIFIIILLMSLISTSCMNTTTSDEKTSANNTLFTINGSVGYRERMLPPPGSRLTIRVNNTSRADAPAVKIAEQVIDLDDRRVPVDFKFEIPADGIKPRETYTVRAEIRSTDKKLLWTTDQSHRIDTQKPSQSLPEIMLVKVK